LSLVRTCVIAVTLTALSGAAWPLQVSGADVGREALAGSAQASSSLAAPGPFVLSGPDSTSRLRLRFAGQMILDYTSTEAATGDDRSGSLVMHARRIRPTMELNLLRPKLLLRLHLSTAPKSLEMMDYYLDLTLEKNLRLRYGQYKVPFTVYRIESFQALTLVDWAIVTKGFGAERQMGLSIHNGYEKPPRLGYALGVFTGVNARAAHAVYLPKLYDEEIPNPSDLSGSAPYAEFHPEIVLNLSYNRNGIDVRSGSDGCRSGLRYSAALSAAWDLDPEPHQDLKLRLAPELLLKCRGASIRGIGYAGFVELAGCDETELGMTGALVESAYRFNGRYEVAARFATVDFTDKLLDDASSYLASGDSSTDGLHSSSERPSGAALSAGANGPAEALAAALTAGGRVRREDEYRIGFNVYLAGHSLKWQSDFGVLRHHHRQSRALTDFAVRSQFQIVY
jgi:hypothetical protein